MNDNKVMIISVHDLKTRRDANPHLCLIDVREQDEWDDRHIPGALHIPKDDLTAKIGAKVADHDHPIYLHCLGGVRSLNAANALLTMGYKEVYSIAGGIAEWEKAGYPVE